jgi:outer membrane scaffolding protein for murein synthesis (MipA/OmpV family)
MTLTVLRAARLCRRSFPPAALLMLPIAGAAQTLATPPALAPTVQDSHAVRRPLWELGLGLGALSLPDYRGAAERSTYLLPLPYVVYRGRWLRADRDGARAVLLDAEKLEIDISVNGSPPSRHTDRGARAGMERLPATLEIGPNINWTWWRSSSAKLDLRLPLRAAITVEHSPRSIGMVFAPNLNLDLSSAVPGWKLGVHGGPLWASQRYNQHYYGVSTADATVTRPQYDARSGRGGWQATAALSRRFAHTWAGAFVRYDALNGAVFADSPLVQRHQGVTVGLGVSWIFASSAELVAAEE